MKTITILLLTGLFLPGSLFARVGPGTGGGGFTVSCPQTPIEKASTQLLDLYEAEVSLRLRLKPASGSIETDYFQSVDRTYTLQGSPNLAEKNKTEIFQNLKKFFRLARFVQREEDLPKANDLGEVTWIPSQCHVKQVAYFDDKTEVVYILEPLWNQMSSLDQAALVQHESIYRHYRSLGDRFSSFSRLFVAHIFSTNKMLSLTDGLDKVASRKYHSRDLSLALSSDFYVTTGILGAQPVIRIQFRSLFGKAVLSKTWVDIPTAPWQLTAIENSASPLPDCVVIEKNKNIVQLLPIKGIVPKNLYLKYEYITGKKIKLSLVENGITTSESHVVSEFTCAGYPL